MSILTSTIGAWDPFEASLLEWRRLCRRMHLLEGSRATDVERDRTYMGEILWGVQLNKGGFTRMLGVGWEWREVVPNVVALSNPLGISSNVRLKDERGELISSSKLVLYLNAAVGGFRWQADLIKHSSIRRDIAA